MKVARPLLVAVLLVSLGVAPRTSDLGSFQSVRVEVSDEAMGTTFSVVAHGADRATLESAARAALDEAQRLDRVLSNYRPESAWTVMNRDAARGPVRVPQEVFDVVAACLAYSRASNGAFDITVGPLMKVWGFYKGEGTMPAASDVKGALDRIGFRHVHLDARKRTVQFDRTDIELDPGGIGKGYAVDRMVDVLKKQGVRSALVTAGGSSIYGLGAPPDEPRGFRITIRAPQNPQQAVADVFLRDMSLSTSGSYEKFFRAGGRVYAHIMDPRTGYPAQGTAAVSVMAPRTIDSEAWTKPYFINGRTWTTSHVPKTFRVFFCEDGTPPACAWTD